MPRHSSTYRYRVTNSAHHFPAKNPRAMPNYKLTYFNLKGRGELSRLLFAASDVKFEDVRIDMANWNQLKACMRSFLQRSFFCIKTVEPPVRSANLYSIAQQCRSARCRCSKWTGKSWRRAKRSPCSSRASLVRPIL